MYFRQLLILLILVSGCSRSVRRPFGTPLSVSDIPEPPQQSAKWQSSANVVSPEFASATAVLFDQGLADPRGCDYREIEIHLGEPWQGDAGNVKTHGWVLPGAVDTNHLFAVCWNGLVYPVGSVGAPMDLHKDMESLLNLAATNSARAHLGLYGRAFSEVQAASYDSLLPLKSCLLFRLGENEMAAKIWEACRVTLLNSHHRATDSDPYLMLAGDWAWQLFDRTIGAHMRRDVPLALLSARKLAAIQPKIEAEATRRGFPPPPSRSGTMPPSKPRPYLPFLDQMPQLVSDLERRARFPKQKNVIEIGLTNYPKQSDRILVLIEDLDLVSARQMGQPGWVAPQMDPIVQALIKEGNSAVEPLIKCWETDQRLTCSVGFGRDFFRDRQVLRTARAAQVALQEILQTQFGNSAEAGAFWKQYRGSLQHERWYQVLQKESIGKEVSVQSMAAGEKPHAEKMIIFDQGQWMEAARIIVQPANISGVPANGIYVSTPLPPGEKAKLRGEPLRNKRNPSVTELLLKNANILATKSAQFDQYQGVEAIRAGTEVAGIIYAWEKSASDAPARTFMQRAIALWPRNETFVMSSGHDLARFIPQLTQFRVEAGDATALNEYAAWIRSASEEKVDLYAVEAFEPLWQNPSNPEIVKASEWLFNDANSPWPTLPWKRCAFRDPLDSELVKLPAFQRLLARELERNEVIGSIEYLQSGGISYILNNLGNGSISFEFPDANLPEVGAKSELRQCDWLALKLSIAKRIPFFNPFANLEIRNQAIKSAKVELVKQR